MERWTMGKGNAAGAKIRTGQPVTRKDFTALPLREFNLLWHKTLTALSKNEVTGGQKPGEPRLIHITVDGTTGLTEDNRWSLTMELRYQSTEQVYVKPISPANGKISPDAAKLMVVHCPPFSGIGAEEKRMDRGAQQLEVGRGKPGDVLRNLLLEVWQGKEHWDTLVKDIQNLFRLILQEPQYDAALPFIRCEYLDGISKSGKGKNGLTRYDIASGGSGFHQVLLLLCFFYARPASVLLLDEPDAHLHVI
ncbi:SMC domain-containing protein, partial [mine drainage metagenome]